MSMEWNDEPSERPASRTGPRPYIGVMFECCNIYTRIYRRPEDDRYVGRCPRCLAVVQARVGPDGTATRIFRAN